jgi:hypothetical protein
LRGGEQRERERKKRKKKKEDRVAPAAVGEGMKLAAAGLSGLVAISLEIFHST